MDEIENECVCVCVCARARVRASEGYMELIEGYVEGYVEGYMEGYVEGVYGGCTHSHTYLYSQMIDDVRERRACIHPSCARTITCTHTC
jgi:hypothetical protein